jgi:heme/copper-type cytochrome/quinol oxidase subunit 1
MADLVEAGHSPSGLDAPRTLAAGFPFRREAWAWLVLSITALGLAGAFAFLLALSRVPAVETILPWPVDFFHKSLVIHVVFSFIVWFLASFAALCLLATRRLAGDRPRFGFLGPVGVFGTLIAMPLLFTPALLDRGEATLNNYVPTIIDPLYYAGLLLLAAATAMPALRLVANIRPTRLLAEPWAAAVVTASACYLIALACFDLAYRLLGGQPPSFDFNEQLFWGGGHVLQFVNTLLLVAAWGLLLARLTGESAMRSRPLLLAAGLLLLAALPAPWFYLAFDPFSPEQTRAFTLLQYTLGPPVLLLALLTLNQVPRPYRWRDPAFLALALSALVFGVGGALGLFIDGFDTRTPAHYHGVIAGVTLALMGVTYTVLLPATERLSPTSRSMRLQMHLFAWGQLLACLGLFLAGGHGAPRKTAGDAQGLSDVGAMIGMGMNGLGGLVAVISGAMFVWLVARSLARSPATKNRGDLETLGL